MPNVNAKCPEDPSFSDLNSSEQAEIKEMIASIEDSHHLRYKMMNLEAWALAETMDQFIPGFWNRFLQNRRQALKQFIAKKRSDSNLTDLSKRSVPPAERTSYNRRTPESEKRAS